MAYRMTHEIEIEAREIGMKVYEQTKSRIQANFAYQVAKDRMANENVGFHAIRDAGRRAEANCIGYGVATKRLFNAISEEIRYISRGVITTVDVSVHLEEC